MNVESYREALDKHQPEFAKEAQALSMLLNARRAKRSFATMEQFNKIIRKASIVAGVSSERMATAMEDLLRTGWLMVGHADGKVVLQATVPDEPV